MEIAVLVCVRGVLVQTASVDPTVNAPRKASIAVAGPCKCSKSLFFCLLSKSLWLFHVFISFVFIKQVVYRFISSLHRQL